MLNYFWLSLMSRVRMCWRKAWGKLKAARRGLGRGEETLVSQEEKLPALVINGGAEEKHTQPVGLGRSRAHLESAAPRTKAACSFRTGSVLFKPSITSWSPPMERKSFALSTWERADPRQHQTATATGLEIQLHRSRAPCISSSLPISPARSFKKSKLTGNERGWFHTTLPVRMDVMFAGTEPADRWLLSNAEASLMLWWAIKTSLGTCLSTSGNWWC